MENDKKLFKTTKLGRKEILETIQEYWEKNPTLRFCQLIDNVTHNHSIINKDEMRVQKLRDIEDKDLYELLKLKLDEEEEKVEYLNFYCDKLISFQEIMKEDGTWETRETKYPPARIKQLIFYHQYRYYIAQLEDHGHRILRNPNT